MWSVVGSDTVLATYKTRVQHTLMMRWTALVRSIIWSQVIHACRWSSDNMEVLNHLRAPN